MSEVRSRWDEMPESAQRHIAHVIELLAGRFSGRIELECHEGGVRLLHETRTYRGDESADGSRLRKVR